LGIPAVLVPPAPGVLSAYGLLCSDAVEELSRTVFLEPEDGRGIKSALAELGGEAKDLLRDDKTARGRIRIEQFADLRYVGQSYEISIPAGAGLVRRFHAEHERLYGHSEPQARVEVVNVRVRGPRINPDSPLPAPAEMGAGLTSAGAGIWWRGKALKARAYAREELRPGRAVAGPCIVCEYSATTFLPPGWTAKVDRRRNLVLRPA